MGSRFCNRSTRRLVGTVAALLTFSPPDAAAAETFSFITRDGREFKEARLSRRTPDGISFFTADGVQKVRFEQLPEDLQRRFAYDPAETRSFRERKRASDELRRSAEREFELGKRAQREREKLLPELDITVAGTVEAVYDNGLLLTPAGATQPVPSLESRKIQTDGPTTLNPKRPRSYRTVFVTVNRPVPLELGGDTIFVESTALAAKTNPGQRVSVLAYRTGSWLYCDRPIPRFTPEKELAIRHEEGRIKEAWGRLDHGKP